MKIKNIKSITVYCSSSNKISKKYKKQAKNIGIFISKKKIKLIYGGGKNGLMGEVARGVKENKGYVIGIIPEFLKTKENMNTKIDGTTQNETVSAIESNSIPNLDSIPSKRAILPSKTSNIPAIFIATPALSG